MSAQLMRRIMVDHARQRQAIKRGGGAIRVTLDEARWQNCTDIFNAAVERPLTLEQLCSSKAATATKLSVEKSNCF